MMKIPTSKTAAYKAWAQMKYMCNTDNPKFSPNYKAKDIGYEANWSDFDNFWLATRYGWCKGAVLTRKDASKWFTENNCYWQPPKNKKPYKKAKCDSGVWGLKQVTDKNNYSSWVVRLTDHTGRRVSKWWSVDKHGEVQAFVQAVEFLREKQER